MKNLKLGLFCLFTVIAASVFLTSCEQDTILPQQEETTDVQQIEIQSSVQEYINKQDEVTFNLPRYMEGADQNTLQSYLADMTIEWIIERAESYRIENFLGSLGRLDKVYKDLGQFDLLTLNDLKKYTSEQELTDFDSFEVASVVSLRGCETIAETCFLNIKIEKQRCCFWGFCWDKFTLSKC